MVSGAWKGILSALATLSISLPPVEHSAPVQHPAPAADDETSLAGADVSARREVKAAGAEIDPAGVEVDSAAVDVEAAGREGVPDNAKVDPARREGPLAATRSKLVSAEPPRSCSRCGV